MTDDRFMIILTDVQSDSITIANLTEQLEYINQYIKERQKDSCPGSDGARKGGMFHNDPEQDVIELTNLADSLKKVIDWYS